MRSVQLNQPVRETKYSSLLQYAEHILFKNTMKIEEKSIDISRRAASRDFEKKKKYKVILKHRAIIKNTKK